MKDTILTLVNCYKDFLKNVSEYTILTEYIKNNILDEVNNKKLKQPKKMVKYYSLEVKPRDFSHFDKSIIPYLTSNNLYKFLNKDIDPVKLQSIIDDGLLNEDIVRSYIDNEKTILCIKSDEIMNSINKHKQLIKQSVATMDIFSIIKRRELLKVVINDSRYKYFNAAKSTKDVLLANQRTSIKVKIPVGIVTLDIKVIKTIYNDTFKQYLEANNLDVFSYSINDSKLRSSKDKKLNFDIINNHKVEFSKNYLVVKALPGLLMKYNKGSF